MYIRKRGQRRRLADYAPRSYPGNNPRHATPHAQNFTEFQLRRDFGQKSWEQLLPEGSGGVPGVGGPGPSPANRVVNSYSLMHEV